MLTICMLEREATAAPGRYGRVTASVSRWKSDLANYGPGTIDLRLDETADAADLLELRSLIMAADSNLAVKGEKLDGAAINEACRVPGVTFNDYPVVLVRRALSELKALIDF